MFAILQEITCYTDFIVNKKKIEIFHYWTFYIKEISISIFLLICKIK